jgi:autotransporter-associated beta strand protein
LLTLNGGVLESSGTYSRSLGNTVGTNSVNWLTNGSGGFAANGGKLTVTLAGAPSPLLWGSAGSTVNFVNGTGALILGSITADNEVELTQNIQLVGTTTRTIRVDDNTASPADFATLSGVISGTVTTASLTKSGFGTLYLKNNSNSYIGKTFVTNGTLQFDSIANVGAGNVSALGAPTTSTEGTIDIGSSATVISATLKYTGTAPLGHSTDRVVRLAAGGNALSTLDASGVGPIKYTGGLIAVAISGARRTVLTGSNTGDNELGSISGVGGTQLYKSGSGKWILTGANTHTGATIVAAGTLALGSGGTLDNSSYIDVRSGATFDVNAYASGFNLNQNPNPAQTLSGSGTILGKVNVGSGTFVSPGIGLDDLSNGTAVLATNVGELTFSNDLTIDGTYRWNLGALATTMPGTNFDSIKLTGGALTLGATSQLALGFSLLGLNDPNSANPFWTTPGTKLLTSLVQPQTRPTLVL